jgi:branched-chain amino acid transport system substrate-binding protein
VAQGAAGAGREHGFTTVHTYPYLTGTTDFTPLLQQLAHAHPDVLLGVGRIEDDIRLARQLRQAALPIAAVGLIATPLALFRNTLGAAADGFLGPSQWEPDPDSLPEYGPSTPEVLASLAARASGEVDYPMAQAYAGCLVARRCIEIAGGLDQNALRQAASSLDFTTFYGRFRIDPTSGRQLGHVMPVVQWQHGAKVVLWP